MAAQIARPELPFFPGSAAEAKGMAEHRSAAATAASIGWPRGDLWVDAAMAEHAAALPPFDGTDRDAMEPDGQTAMQAAALAPYDARAWVILAALNSQSQAKAAQALTQLRMSYYTLPYSRALLPVRLRVAAQSNIPVSDELQSYITHEVKRAMGEDPELKGLVASELQRSTPAGRQALAEVLSELGQH
jgi:hypothetical protein